MENPSTPLPELAARVKIAGMVISHLLLGAPDARLRFQLSDPQMLAAWPLADEQSEKGLQILREHYENQPRQPLDAEDSTTDLPLEDNTDRDYLYLIRGIGRPLVEPHESARLSHEHLVFEAETLEVRQAYRQAGFQVPNLNVEPDDHIGYEIAFMAELAGKVNTGLSSADQGLTSQAAFLALCFARDHLDRFFEDVVNGLEEHANTAIYRALPWLMRGWRARLQDLLLEVYPQANQGGLDA